ncbi:hypothetical protein [Pseudoalteromonas arctica]|uniref:Lipoprotein n=1 Tax=Pseudoalteromonas arctica TaxID=394751 RepID=A0ABU9THH2_9GAMM
MKFSLHRYLLLLWGSAYLLALSLGCISIYINSNSVTDVWSAWGSWIGGVSAFFAFFIVGYEYVIYTRNRGIDEQVHLKIKVCEELLLFYGGTFNLLLLQLNTTILKLLGESNGSESLKINNTLAIEQREKMISLNDSLHHTYAKLIMKSPHLKSHLISEYQDLKNELELANINVFFLVELADSAKDFSQDDWKFIYANKYSKKLTEEKVDIEDIEFMTNVLVSKIEAFRGKL